MIWLASFPRSGNTFVRNILFDVYGLESTAVNERHLDYFSTHPEYPVSKTHLLPEQIFPLNEKTPVVYLVRDGRDALVSLAYHRTNIIAPGSDFLTNLNDAFLALGGSHFGGWETNVKRWLEKADIVIRFEDLIKDPIGEMTRLKDIVDLPEPNVSQLPTFESQQQGQPRYGSALGRNKHFFRKGKIGDWKTEMPPSMQEAFWKKNAGIMKTLGYGRSGKVDQRPKRIIKPSQRFYSRLARLWNPVKAEDSDLQSKPKTPISPDLIYFDTGADYSQRFKRDLFDAYENRVIEASLTSGDKPEVHLNGTDLTEVKRPYALMVNFSKFTLDEYFDIESAPLLITWVGRPLKRLLFEYASEKSLDVAGLIDTLNELTEEGLEDNDFISFAKEYRNRNIMNRVISKFSGSFLHFSGNMDDYEASLSELLQMIPSAELSKHASTKTIEDLPSMREVRKRVKKLNRKDFDIFWSLIKRQEQKESTPVTS